MTHEEKNDVVFGLAVIIIVMAIGAVSILNQTPTPRYTVQVLDQKFGMVKSWQHCRLDPNASQYKTYTFWDSSGTKIRIPADTVTLIEEKVKD